ncbi:4-hydroxy-tetrahydrodipicolinate synthase [Lampropedia aestuarii]|uniref:4-hydroxy-tetrahydrodipicolinate synthase n=1 Tax=Lampropedia aestuarii TaxID=2562762 RepID=A0A4S5BQF0_9BURK|nr:4-hydroxy-tetrahydrodipicolinate synthase [Lampropedia aestuarii]THJ33403.1 4-hydroxy-tetrahydrodipicolinate synthase [Lampropedia aestuarii]
MTSEQAHPLHVLSGSTVALVTPMDAAGAVDYPALRRLVDWHIEQGTCCICVVGTTGESPTVTVDEHCEIIRVAVEQAAGRIPIMAGCGANSTAEAIALARYASEVGAKFQLQVVPYYNRPTQAGMVAHFSAIADATPELPMVLYNVPGRTVADMQHETVLHLAQLPSIVGIKEATADMVRAQWLIREAPAGFGVYSGDDLSALALMLCGGHGCISVTANIAPQWMARLCAAAIRGDAHTANRLQHQLLPLHEAMFCQANPIPVKWAMQRAHLCGAHLRLPLTPLEAPYQAMVEQAMHDLHLLP